MKFISPDSETRRKLFHWAAAQPFCILLDSCGTEIDRFGEFEWLLAVSPNPNTPRINHADALHSHLKTGGDWFFGAFSYEAKQAFEPRMVSRHDAVIPVPELNFFCPEFVVAQLRGEIGIQMLKGEWADLFVRFAEYAPSVAGERPTFDFTSNFDRTAYLNAVSRVRAYIREGDTYEMNLTQCYSALGELPQPFTVWEEMKAVSPTPFAGFAKWGDLHLLCASPERFLQLQHGHLRTQPIKGTASRKAGRGEDADAAAALRESEKERAENVMIVDLSRNDLHRVCEPGSVTVPFLFEVQSFRQVHHLVSTVEGKKRKEIDGFSAIAAAFPPGSMTGAPKIRTCELIEEIEGTGRGLYSGSLGYFKPTGDFDFNVVIRSVVYDAKARKLSYHVGGAVTWDSEPEAEYAETLLKAKGIAAVLAK